MVRPDECHDGKSEHFFDTYTVEPPVQVDKQRSSLVPRPAGSEHKHTVVRTQPI